MARIRTIKRNVVQIIGRALQVGHDDIRRTSSTWCYYQRLDTILLQIVQIMQRLIVYLCVA